MAGTKTNEREGTRAVLRYARVSPYKAREVLDLIRGKPVGEAEDILRFCERDVAIADRQAAALRGGQRREQRPAGPRGPVRVGLLRRRGHDHQALAAPGPGPGHPDPQAHLSHHDHREPAARGEAGPPAEPAPGRAWRPPGPPGGRRPPDRGQPGHPSPAARGGAAETAVSIPSCSRPKVPTSRQQEDRLDETAAVETEATEATESRSHRAPRPKPRRHRRRSSTHRRRAQNRRAKQ